METTDKQKSSQYISTIIPPYPFYAGTSKRAELVLNEENKCIVMSAITKITTEDIYIYHCGSNSWKQINYDPKLSLNNPNNIIMFGRKYLIHVNVKDNRWNTIPKQLKIQKNGFYFIINNQLNFFSTDHKRYIWNPKINKFKFISHLAADFDIRSTDHGPIYTAKPGIYGPIYLKSKHCFYSFAFDERPNGSPTPSSLYFDGICYENKLKNIYSYSLLTNKYTELNVEISFKFEVLKIVSTINDDYILFFGSPFQTTNKYDAPCKKKSILIFNVNTNKFRMSKMDCTWFEKNSFGSHMTDFSVMTDFYDSCLLINGFIHFILNIFNTPNDIKHLIQSMYIGNEFVTICYHYNEHCRIQIPLNDILY